MKTNERKIAFCSNKMEDVPIHITVYDGSSIINKDKTTTINFKMGITLYDKPDLLFIKNVTLTMPWSHKEVLYRITLTGLYRIGTDNHDPCECIIIVTPSDSLSPKFTFKIDIEFDKEGNVL